MLSIFQQPLFYDEKRFHISIASKPGLGLVASDKIHTVNINPIDHAENEEEEDVSPVISVESISVKIGNRNFEMLFTSSGAGNRGGSERKLIEIRHESRS